MSRYFIYAVLLNMLINTIVFVPKLLMEERFDGAIAAMMFAVPVSSFLAYAFSRAMSRFPGQGLPEILQGRLPEAIRRSILLFFGILWFIAGLLILVAFAIISERFINPEIPKWMFLLCSSAVVCWGATRRTTSIMSMLEVGIVLSLPLVALITFQALSDEMLDWDAIAAMTDYAFRLPSFTAMAATTYMFTGYLNLVILNRHLEGTRFSHRWLIPVVGIVVFLTTFFIPIGIHGTQAVDDYIYVWISTADSLRMKFGFVERVLFMFLFLYIGLALLFVTLVWNIGLGLVRSAFDGRLRSERTRAVFDGSTVVAIGVATIGFGLYTSEKELIQAVTAWFQFRVPFELLLVATIVYFAWRKKHA